MDNDIKSFQIGKGPLKVTSKMTITDDGQYKRVYVVNGVHGIDNFLVNSAKIEDGWVIMRGFDDNGDEVTVGQKIDAN